LIGLFFTPFTLNSAVFAQAVCLANSSLFVTFYSSSKLNRHSYDRLIGPILSADLDLLLPVLLVGYSLRYFRSAINYLDFPSLDIYYIIFVLS
jgi:hypothetical protein